jgi:hypothetical protein
MLLVPGDLGDKADPIGIKAAWEALQKLSSSLGSTVFLATAGNHDLDSRFKGTDYDARGFLQALRPRFPISDEREFDRYWSRHFAVVDTGKALVVLLNSCAYHGHAVGEIDHGRVSAQTLQELGDVLASFPRRSYQILLCHHHPEQHMELGLGELDVMKGGQLLIDFLGDGTRGRWLVVHGHKHHPKLNYAAGSSTSPVVVSAASFSVTLYRDLQTRTKNQFHIIELDEPKVHQLGLAGTVRSWNWAVGVGWQAAAAGGGLPHISGFGFRGDPDSLAAGMDLALTQPTMTWEAMVQAMPNLRYVLPQDFATVQRALRDHNISLVFNDGLPFQVGRSV